MKKLFYSILACGFLATQIACDKYADDYKQYLDDHEIIYPGLARDVRSQAGYLRAVLVWNPSPDPNIDHYVVYWNNKRNSQRVEATTHNPSDNIVVSIPNLEEYVYSFTIIAYDSEGNSSVGQELNNVRVYGATYRSVLNNRAYRASEPYETYEDGSLKLYFNAPDTLNTGTEIKYTDRDEQEKTIILLPGDNDITIPDFKFGTTLQYRSGYVPEPNAADTIYTLSWENFPTIIHITAVDKSLFNAMLLPGDNNQEYGWVLSNLWNNRYYKSDSDNPDEGFHTAGTGMPQSFTFDLGKTVKLDNFKLWQRDNALYKDGNIKVFEVWGSSTVPDADGSWTGWTKLETFTSVKPSGLPLGQVSDGDRTYARAGEKFVIPPSAPNVRYIRFNVLETWGGSGYLHLTELTFFEIN